MAPGKGSGSTIHVVLKTKKRCHICHKSKPLGEFYKCKRSPDGIDWHCKICDAKRHHNYYDRNKEKCKRANKNYRIKNPNYNREYYLKNREHINRRNCRNAHNKWFSNVELSRKLDKEKYAKLKKDNPERLREILSISNRNRRARMKGQEGKVTRKEWNDLLNRCAHKCLRCKKKNVKLTMDHIIPLALGGKHLISNIQPLCQSCNSTKFLKTTDYRPKKLVAQYTAS